MIEKGSYVEIHKIILHPLERSQKLPKETKAVPLEMKVKGFLVEDGSLGEIVTIKTMTGRTEKGRLVDITPSHKHNFGNFVPEVIQMTLLIKAFMNGSDDFGSFLS